MVATIRSPGRQVRVMAASGWPYSTYYNIKELCHNDVYRRLAQVRKSLSELRLRGDQMEKENIIALLESEKLRDEEMAKMKEDLEKEVNSKMAELENKVHGYEEEITTLRMENAELREKLDSLTATSKKQQKYSTNNGITRQDLKNGLSSTDDERFNEEVAFDAKEVQKLRQRLHEAEDRARKSKEQVDRLEILLNEKIIATNKLQLTLSSQTKDLMKLEKAYYTLRRHLSRTQRITTPSPR